MKIAITCESTVDLPKELLLKYDIKTIPFTIILGDEEKKDGEVLAKDIFDFVSKTKILPKTTAINEFEYTEFFEEVLADNDALIHIALSSGISSSCSHAQAAAEKMKNVYIIDSKSLSTGIALQAIYASKLRESISNPEEIVEKVVARQDGIQASFIVEKLDYLHKGGRCSGIALLGANVLKIRPRIIVSGGKMKNDRKYRGQMAFAVKKYCEECLNESPDIDKSLAFVTYSSATPEMIEIATNALKDAGVETVYETKAGGTITSHCGENTLGILFYNDGIKTL